MIELKTLEKGSAERPAFLGACVAVSLVIALIVLIGWTIDLTSLKRVAPSMIMMLPNIRLGSLVAGGALWALVTRAVRRVHSRGLTARERNQSDHALRLMADAMPQLAWIARPDGHVFWYNRRWFDYTGTTPEQMEGWGWQTVHDAAELPKVLERWKVCIASGESFEMVLPLRRADGRFRLFLTRVEAFRDDSGRTIHWFGTNTDIEEQKRAEEELERARADLERRVDERTAELALANEGLRKKVEERRRSGDVLRRSEQQFRTLADSIPQLAWMARPDGYIFWYNQRWYDYTGTTLEQMQGWGWQSVHDPAELPRVVETITASYASGEPWDCTFPLRRHDGVFRWHLSRMLPVRDDAGRVIMWFGSNTDITEQKQMETSLREAKEAAEAATRAKSDFLANMSHEIRTPMNGVIGMTDLLLDTQLDDIQRDYAEIIRVSADALLTVINDILDFSKIEAGKLTLQEADLDLTSLITEVANLLGPRARQKGLKVNCRIESNVPRRLRGDAVRIRQVLTNLGGNAVKFTDRGEVNLEARALDVDGRDATLLILVRDTGVGIPADRQADVFESFTQIDGGRSRSHGGTGLGLAICRKLVGLMGGTMGLESEPGKGSTFWFELTLGVNALSSDNVLSDELVRPNDRASAGSRIAPFSTTSSGIAARECAQSQPPVLPLVVLVAEDNAINRAVAQGLVERLGCVTDVVVDGRQAVERFDPTRHDMVLMDIQMPEMDGLAATAAIRARENGTGRHVPIIALTAHAMVGDREKCLAAGMDDYLTKPLRAAALSEILARWGVSRKSPSPLATGGHEGGDGQFNPEALAE